MTVTNCVLITTEMALKIGSETYGEFRNITFSNCAIRCRHVRDLEVEGFVGRQAKGSEAPAISLRSVKNAFIHDCRAPAGAGVFVGFGEGSERLTLMNNDLAAAATMVEVAPGVSRDEVHEAGNRAPRG